MKFPEPTLEIIPVRFSIIIPHFGPNFVIYLLKIMFQSIDKKISVKIKITFTSRFHRRPIQ